MLVAVVLFARRVAHLVQVTSVLDPDGSAKIYRVSGQLFFASSNDLVAAFDPARDPADVVVDLSGAHVWDASTVAVLDAITARYAARGTRLRIVGMNDDSRHRHEALAGRLAAH